MKEEIKKILNDAKKYLQQQGILFGDEVTLPKSESEGEGKIQQVNEKEYGVDPTWINSKTLDELESKIKNCVKCPLGKNEN
jgi:hypothetical protein